MSGGQNKKEPQLVTVTTEEFGEICQRVHKFLLDRADEAKGRRDKRATKKNVEDHLEFSKDVFAFVHLMELVDNMTTEIQELRDIINAIGMDADPDGDEDLPELYSAPKKQFLN